MTYFTLEKRDSVYLLTMVNSGVANALDDDMLEEMHRHLDTIESDPAPHLALVITSADPKFFSNGINLDFIRSRGMDYLFASFVPRLDALLARLAWLNVPTLAAINGHAYGGGALMAAACDFRFMRADRGRICFPEVDLKLSLSDVMVECLGNLPNEKVRWEMAVTGLALGGDEAAAVGVVDKALSEESLLEESLTYATYLASKDRRAYTRIKRAMRGARWARKKKKNDN